MGKGKWVITVRRSGWVMLFLLMFPAAILLLGWINTFGHGSLVLWAYFGIIWAAGAAVKVVLRLVRYIRKRIKRRRTRARLAAAWAVNPNNPDNQH